MSIDLFYTPFEVKGSTKELFKKTIDTIRGSDYSRILYVAPSLSKIYDTQRILHPLLGDCYIPPAMMTLTQLSQRFFSLYENRKIIPQGLIPVILSKLSNRHLGYSCLIANFVNEMKEYQPGKSMAAITSDIRSVFDRLGIPDELSLRVMEALRIMDLYEEILKKHNAADKNDVMKICPGIIREHDIGYDCLIIDGFSELTAAEEEIIKALIENTRDTTISIPYNIDFTNIFDRYITFLNNNFRYNAGYFSHEEHHIRLAHYSYRNAEDEIEGIARSIKNHFIAGVATDLNNVFVVFPELHKYSDMISRVFKKYGIPFTISSEKPLARTKPFLDLVALFDSVSDDYPRLQFSQFLISPYFKALPSSMRKYIPSLCISSGFTKGKTAWLNLMKSERSHPHSEFIRKNESQTIEKDITWVFRKLSYLESIRHKASFIDYGEAVGNLLRDFDFDDGRNHDMTGRDKIIKIVNDLSLMDSFSDTAPTDLHNFTEALRHCLLNEPSLETDTPGVRVLRFMDMEGLEPKYLYFGGLRDGDFPIKPEIDHLMPDSVRTQLGLMNMEKYLRYQKFLFRRALSSAKNYYLSYSVMEGDRLFLPSSFLSWNEEITKPACGIFSIEEDLVRKGGVFRFSFVSDVRTTDMRRIQKLFGEKAFIRVTDIDAYRTCPRKFFIERVLSLKPLEIMKFEMEALTLGTVVHEIMQELISEFTADVADVDDIVLNASRKIDALLYRKPFEDYWKKVLKETFLTILPDICRLEQMIADDGYAFMGAEVPVKAEVLPGITLKGKIDRIDKRIETEGSDVNSEKKGTSINSSSSSVSIPVAELIDYKTGSTQFSGSQILSQGMNLQLLLYAALMKSKGMLVNRVGIYSLKDLSLSWIPNKHDRRNGRSLEDYVDAALSFLGETVIEMRKGEFPAHPLHDRTCRNCPERPYCPYIQKAVMVQQ
jgi:ATP-dependent helicase/DNAse subunit B